MKVSDSFVRDLQAIFGPFNVLTSPVELLTYEYDGTILHATPGAVVFPTSAGQLAAMVRLCNRHGVPYTARGAGTNLSGGSIPAEGGVVVSFSKMNRILEIDVANRRAVCEPGVVNLDLKNRLAPLGFTYAPDPASQKVSTLGGNVAENAGGPHCLKYGVTTNHIVGLEVVLPDGDIVQVGGRAEDVPGYDLVGLFVGAEGTLGLVTQIVVRIVPLPEAVKTMLAVFETIRDASETVSEVIARGILPAALELIDHQVIQVVEATVHAGLPTDAAAVLLIELDGLPDGMDRAAEVICDLCLAHHAREVKIARTEEERDKLWAGRRGAFGSLARLRPSIYIVDGTVPRTRLPDVLDQVYAIADKYDLVISNMFHAGDGNLHPQILFDARDPDELRRALAASEEILDACIAAGGTITGEHGVGLEKRADMARLYSADVLEAMWRVKRTLDPAGLCNPEKVLPAVTRGI
jgi:glycolate oxidase